MQKCYVPSGPKEEKKKVRILRVACAWSVTIPACCKEGSPVPDATAASWYRIRKANVGLVGYFVCMCTKVFHSGVILLTGSFFFFFLCSLTGWYNTTWCQL